MTRTNDRQAPVVPVRGARGAGARRFSRLARVAPAGVLALAATGCGVPSFGFPTTHATVQSLRVYHLWQGSAIAALAVGAFVLGLILWAPFRYRKRGDDLPRQVRYNLPIEVLYTAVPFVIIATLFYYTAKDESYLDRLTPPAKFQAAHGVTVDVIGYQWQWKFDYPDYKVAVAGSQYQQPTLYVPVGRPVQFVERSEDVIHSFWVIDWQFKRDVIPGRINQFEVTPSRAGTYIGRCAELCGVYHDRMYFTVVALDSPAFDAKMAQMRRDNPDSNVADSVPAPRRTGDSNSSNGLTAHDPNSKPDLGSSR